MTSKRIFDFLNDVKDSIDIFETRYNNARDPLSVLLSDDGLQLLTLNLSGISEEKKKDFVLSVLTEVNKDLKSRSKGNYGISHVNYSDSDLTLEIGSLKYPNMIYWDLYKGTLVIPLYDKVYEVEQEQLELEESIAAYNEELNEVQHFKTHKKEITNENPVLWIKHVVQPKKLDQNIDEALREIQAEKAEVLNQYKENKRKLEGAINSTRYLELLEILNSSIFAFPNIHNYSDYIDRRQEI